MAGIDAAEVDIAKKSTGFPLDHFPEDVRPLMEGFDMDGSGEIDASELAYAAKLLREAQDANKRLKKAVIGISTLLALTLGTIFGLVWAVVSAMKQTNTGNDGEMKVKGTSKMVTTGSLNQQARELDDFLSARTDDDTLNSIDRYEIVGKVTASLAVSGWVKGKNTKTSTGNLTFFTEEGPIVIDGNGLVYSNSTLLHAAFEVPDLTMPLNLAAEGDSAVTTSTNIRRVLSELPNGRKLGGDFTVKLSSGKTQKVPQGDFVTLKAENCPVGSGLVPKTSGMRIEANKFVCSKCDSGYFRNEAMRKVVTDDKADKTIRNDASRCILCGVFNFTDTTGSSDCKYCPNCKLPRSAHSMCVDLSKESKDPDKDLWMGSILVNNKHSDLPVEEKNKIYAMIAECKKQGGWAGVEKNSLRSPVFKQYAELNTRMVDTYNQPNRNTEFTDPMDANIREWLKYPF